MTSSADQTGPVSGAVIHTGADATGPPDPWNLTFPSVEGTEGRWGTVPRSTPETEELVRLSISRVPEGMALVSRDSPDDQMEAVARLAHYFRREADVSMAGYDPSTCGHDTAAETVAFLFLDDSPYTPRVIGAGCFRWRESRGLPSPLEGLWALQWVYVHPVVRGQGKLRRAWSFFESAFGPFKVEEPLSPAMVGFLRKRSARYLAVESKGERFTIPVYGERPTWGHGSLLLQDPLPIPDGYVADERIGGRNPARDSRGKSGVNLR